MYERWITFINHDNLYDNYGWCICGVCVMTSDLWKRIIASRKKLLQWPKARRESALLEAKQSSNYMQRVLDNAKNSTKIELP